MEHQELNKNEFSNMQTQQEVRGNYFFLEETTTAIHNESWSTGTSHQHLLHIQYKLLAD